jgi:hypothetical protein
MKLHDDDVGATACRADVPNEIRTRPRLVHNLDQIAWKVVPKDEPATLE